MQGWMPMIAASAVLSAGLVAGLAAADAASAPTTAWIDPPAKTIKVEVAKPEAPKPKAPKVGSPRVETVAPACRAAAWPNQPAGCSAQGRPVRVIALSQR